MSGICSEKEPSTILSEFEYYAQLRGFCSPSEKEVQVSLSETSETDGKVSALEAGQDAFYARRRLDYSLYEFGSYIVRHRGGKIDSEQLIELRKQVGSDANQYVGRLGTLIGAMAMNSDPDGSMVAQLMGLRAPVELEAGQYSDGLHTFTQAMWVDTHLKGSTAARSVTDLLRAFDESLAAELSIERDRRGGDFSA